MADLLLVDDSLFELHAPSANHPERPARLSAARTGLRRTGVRTREVPPSDADRALLSMVHTAAYLDTLDALRGRRAMLDADTYLAPKSVDAAIRAAGGTALLGEMLARGEGLRGLALVRPPGHHAEPDHAMGFCLLNNAALAAAAARRAGARKVAIVDIDVHHGNGTQTMFWQDPNVLYLSLHQWPFYPGTGAVDERGEGPGLGTTVNVPLSEGSGDAAYAEAMRRVVVPTLGAFDAELVIVSAGFDAFVDDPLAGMALSARGYAEVVGAIVYAAEKGSGRVAMVLEGGYDLNGLEECIAAATRALLDDTHAPKASGPLDPRHRLDIDRAARTAAQNWPAEA